MREILLKGGYGGAIALEVGEILEIVNVSGRQICDFFAFARENVAEAISPSHLRSELRRIVLRTGDVLVSQLRNPMLELIEDTCGVHDIMVAPCDPLRYERRFGLRGHRSCRTNLAEAVADLAIPYERLPDPINFFQNTPIAADGTYDSQPSTAKAGDKVVLRALRPLVAAGSACPMSGIFNNAPPTDIRFVVRG